MYRLCSLGIRMIVLPPWVHVREPLLVENVVDRAATATVAGRRRKCERNVVRVRSTFVPVVPSVPLRRLFLFCRLS